MVTDCRLSSRLFAIVALFILLFGACNSSRPSPTEDADPERYDEARAMSYFLSNPAYAMTLLDSAYITGNISNVRRQYLKAIVMYNGYSHPDSSLLMCRHLVESDEWNEVKDTAMLVDVYSLMATMAGTLNRHADVIHYAQLASELAHGHPDMSYQESDLLSRVGRTMAFLGQQEEGLELIMRAFDEVDGSKDWPTFMTSINIGRKVAFTQLEMNQADDALTTFRRLLERLEYFRIHAQEFDDLQQSMQQNEEAIEGYVNYMSVRCYAGMINCFASLGAPDSALHWMKVMDKYPEMQDQFVKFGMIPSLVKLHLDDLVREDVDELIKTLGSDTLDLDYVRMLVAMSELERNHNNWKASNNYLVRALAVRDRIEQESFRNQLTDQLTIYQLQDERFNRMDAEAKSRRLFSISAFLSLLLLLLTVIGITMSVMHKLKTLRRVHDDTQTELKEAKHKIEKLSKGYVPESPEQLYQRIMDVMETKKPYTDQDFDIPQLASMVHSNRTYVSKVINRQSGMNFRTWLAQYRINLVREYMKENPDASLDELCVTSGYASRTSLFHHFKKITGYTPIGWLNSQEEEEDDSKDS